MKRAPGKYDGLTVRQADLLSFLRHEAKAGRTPSYDEMRISQGLATKSGVHRLAAALEERGYIRRMHNRARSIEVFESRAEARNMPEIRALAAFTTGDLIKELERRLPGRHAL